MAAAISCRTRQQLRAADLVIEITPDGSLRIDGKEYATSELGQILRAKTDGRETDQQGMPLLQVELRCDTGTLYAHVGAVLAKCRQACLGRLVWSLKGRRVLVHIADPPLVRGEKDPGGRVSADGKGAGPSASLGVTGVATLRIAPAVRARASMPAPAPSQISVRVDRHGSDGVPLYEVAVAPEGMASSVGDALDRVGRGVLLVEFGPTLDFGVAFHALEIAEQNMAIQLRVVAAAAPNDEEDWFWK
jgi:hypothetical protein